MRTNLPITQREHPIPKDATLMSTTDEKGVITYANEAFIAACGFTLDELHGKAHNIVRHPDMPPAAFADMWKTIQHGKPWTALVKNRHKNGDHYWVRANATPVVRNNQLAGYMSVRTAPSPEETQAAEKLYTDLREGRRRNRRIHKGVLIRTGLLSWMSLPQTMSTAARLACGSYGATALIIAGLWAIGAESVPTAVLAVLSAWTLGCGALVHLWHRKQITQPLAKVLNEAERIAAGHRPANQGLDRVDDIGMLMRSVTQAGLNTCALADDVGIRVGSVGSASDQIASGNRDLSHRTAESMCNLQRTAAAMEQMTSNIQRTADTARQAKNVADEAAGSAARGGQVVGEVVATMGEIAEASRKIGDIISVIDGLAFQTNLLALNAAVEAARAGEQGKGFAVVAGEVRRLAQSSADAAREIKALIEASMSKVEIGGQQVRKSGEAINDIVAQARHVAELIGDIDVATNEQAAGIADVNQAMAELDGSTAQNAALAEETQAAAESLRQQIERLNQAVAVFKIDAAMPTRASKPQRTRVAVGQPVRPHPALG